MKVSIVVTTPEGQTYEGEATLKAVSVSGTATKAIKKAAPAKPAKQVLNLGLPIRAFAKQLGRDSSGAQKFVGLVAKLAGGKTGVEVNVKDVESQWSKLTGSLGKYNGAHSSRAKDNGWVDSTKAGFYMLVPGWEAAFN